MPPLTDAELAPIDAWWRAANYLTIGQIYLRDNPLLREPLKVEHVKPRLLGHWGTCPGLSLIYVHLNRLIRQTGANVLYVTGPGHGGPSIVANVYLEGTYSEVYPHISRDTVGLTKLFRQFSTPGGIPSHVSPDTPGSIHEGGELGYCLVHAFGAAFDNPNLIVACVVGDGEAETAPLEGGWKGVKFLNPIYDGAVLPILHLNGYKIAGPTVLARDTDESIRSLLAGHGYETHFVEGHDPAQVHRDFAATLAACYAKIRDIQTEARTKGFKQRPVWPAIVLRTPKGWTGPKEVDGKPVEGTFRSHQVPLARPMSDPKQLRMLEEWMKSYRPEELFEADGRLKPEIASLAPDGDLRMGAIPCANGGRIRKPLDLPDFRDYALAVPKPATTRAESTRQLGLLLRDVFRRTAKDRNFRLFCPDETNSNRLGNVFEATDRCFENPTIPIDDHVAADGRVMEVLSEHCSEGWLEGYLLTGRHGMFASYEAFAMIVASMAIQHGKWLDTCAHLPWRISISSLNILLTSTCWRNDHNGFSHQGPGFIDTVLTRRPDVCRVYLPPDANSLLSVADHCLRSTNYINLIVIDKQPQLQWLDTATALENCRRGASVWPWAGNETDGKPDVVLCGIGDIVTQEIVAAAWLLRHRLPELKIRVVNVIDLMKIPSPDVHPHGMDDAAFNATFTADKDVVVAFHGYPRAVHSLLHGRANAGRFHVRGYEEEGTTTTPFDMVVLNRVSRFDLCRLALEYAPPALKEKAGVLADWCAAKLAEHRKYVVENLDDMPEVRDWVWSD